MHGAPRPPATNPLDAIPTTLVSGVAIRRVVVAGVAIAAMLVGRPVLADATSEAADLFRAATAAYERREFRAAALAFEEAYRRAPRAAVAYNAGLAWEAAGDAPRAADDYETAVADPSLDAPSRADARTRLDALERSLATVRVTAPAGDDLTVAHVERARIPTTVHLAPGKTYEARVITADGRSATSAIAATVGRTSIALAQPPAPPRHEPPPPQPPEHASSSVLPILGWTAIALGAASAGTAVVLGLEAKSTRDSFDATGDTDAQLRSRAITLRTLTNVAWASAGVFGVAGVVMLLVAPSSDRGVALAVGARDVSLHGRF